MTRANYVAKVGAALLVLGGAGAALGLALACGSSGGSDATPNVAASLAGLRWELPCTSPGSPFCPTVVDGSDVRVVKATLSGTSGQTYAVTLHFRGVVEEKTYVGNDAGGASAGSPDGAANPQFFVSGGADNGDTANVYELQVSDPPQTYFMNAGASSMPHTSWLDYVATIPMKAGATITLTANAVDDSEYANSNGVDGGPVLVPGVPPYPMAYDGQFIQIDVASVAMQP
jgi:hypothetical protein